MKESKLKKLQNYESGQVVSFRVIGPEPGGYTVLIENDPELLGFIPSIEPLKIGSSARAKFVCIHKERVLLSVREPTKH
jgi:hypothetical protein